MPSEQVWKLLIADDDAHICSDVKQALERGSFGEPPSRVEVSIESQIANTANRLRKERFDLLIQDIFVGLPDRGVDHGLVAFDEVKQLQFVPIIFYTARPEHVQSLDLIYVRIVDKAEGTDSLRKALEYVFDTRLPALIRHLEDVQRSYLWTDLPKLIQESTRPLDIGEPACLVARRLAQTMSGDSLRKFLNVKESKVHPGEFYVIPPTGGELLSGNIYREELKDVERYWILLTPSCDLVPAHRRRATQYLLFAQCFLLSEQVEYKNWVKSLGQGQEEQQRAEDRLVALLRNSRGHRYQPSRYYFLPGIMKIPDLVVDYQVLRVQQRAAVQEQSLNCIARLDSPYTEQLLTRFAQYFGRVGTPDLDTELTLERLKAALNNAG